MYSRRDRIRLVFGRHRLAQIIPPQPKSQLFVFKPNGIVLLNNHDEQ